MYVKIANGAVDQYPYTVGNLRRDNPNTSFPKRMSDAALEEWGLYRVTMQDEPSYNVRTQNTNIASTPTLVDGAWTLTWTVTDKTAEEIAQYDAIHEETQRSTRDQYLFDTDWWAMSDRTMTAEQTAYRQALRNITSHANWPYLEESDWPTKP